MPEICLSTLQNYMIYNNYFIIGTYSLRILNQEELKFMEGFGIYLFSFKEINADSFIFLFLKFLCYSTEQQNNSTQFLILRLSLFDVIFKFLSLYVNSHIVFYTSIYFFNFVYHFVNY